MEGFVDEIDAKIDGTISTYSLDFDNHKFVRCCFKPSDVEGTGEVLSEEEFMERFFGDSVFIKVRVDADGKGTVVSED